MTHIYTRTSFLKSSFDACLIMCMLCGAALTSYGQASLPLPDHVVIVIEENQAGSTIYGSPSAPNLNALINDTNAAYFSQSYAITHPSQPNYLCLFSGSTQNVIDDNVPTGIPYTTANLARELMDASGSFKTYSADLPSVGYNGASSGQYARKHNPVTNWTGTGTNQVPDTLNQPFSAFPTTDFSSLPTVSYVVPNMDSDMHNFSGSVAIGNADRWFGEHLSSYMQWALTHNSLLILTFDEDDHSNGNRIFTVFYGPMVHGGAYTDTINHFNVLRTLEDIYSTGHAGSAATATPITNCWKTTPSGVDAIAGTDHAVHVSPVPASSLIQIDMSQLSGPASLISITDVMGRDISQISLAGSRHMTVDVAGYPAGLYFVHILQHSGEQQTSKFVVSH